MAFRVIDEVTADSLEAGDLIYVTSEYDDDKYVYFMIDDVYDEGSSITIYGFSLDMDDEQFKVYLDPDQKMSLHMEFEEDED